MKTDKIIQQAVAEARGHPTKPDWFESDTKALKRCLAKHGLTIVPIIPTSEMLAFAGTMEGWDGQYQSDADRNHIDWYQLMLKAAEQASVSDHH